VENNKPEGGEKVRARSHLSRGAPQSSILPGKIGKGLKAVLTKGQGGGPREKRGRLSSRPRLKKKKKKKKGKSGGNPTTFNSDQLIKERGRQDRLSSTSIEGKKGPTISFREKRSRTVRGH